MNIKAIADKLGIDYENILEDFCGDVSELSMKMQEFATSDVVEKLNQALQNADQESVKQLAHKVRNTGDKIGLANVAKAARRVEEADKDKLKSATLVLIEKLEEAISTIKSNEEEE